MLMEGSSAETTSGLLASDYPLSAYSEHWQGDLCPMH